METATTLNLGSSSRRAVGLFHGLAIAAIAGLAAALFAGVIADLAAEWWNESSSSYGMLVPPLAFYIAWLRRHATLAIPAQPDARGLGLVFLGCLVFLAGKLAAEFYLARISVVILLAGLAWTFWGSRRFKTLLFPLILLGTMVPLPTLVYNAIAAPLQLFASSVATDLAQVLGTSVYRDGNIIHLAHTSLGVEEACSGLHSLSALMVASLLLGYLEDATVLGRVLLLAVSIPLAIAVNVFRVAGTAVLADYRLEFAMGFYHSFSGWLVFVLGFGTLWLAAKLLFRWIGARK